MRLTLTRHSVVLPFLLTLSIFLFAGTTPSVLMMPNTKIQLKKRKFRDVFFFTLKLLS